MFSVDLEGQGFAGCLVTHRGKPFLRVVASPSHYIEPPTLNAVIDDIDKQGIGFSAIIVDKGFKMGLFTVVGSGIVPTRYEKLPLFQYAHFVAEYSDETLEMVGFMDYAPAGEQVFAMMMLPPWGLVNCLRCLLVERTHYWDPTEGLCPIEARQ